MRVYFFIAIGGALGALSRYWLSNYINEKIHTHVHFGTLTVNILGSFLIGIMYVLIAEKLYLHPEWRNVIIIGFLGAFTTFSTFSLEAITFIENGQIGVAGAYVLASVVLCILAAGGAVWLTRLV